MKKIALFIAFLCFAQISNAQKQGALLTDNDLKGKVKKVTQLMFVNGKNETDTLQRRFTTILEFDQKGNLIEETRLNNKVFFYKIKYLYNSDSTITGKKYDADKDMIGGITLRYDNLGILVEIKREGSMFGPPRQIFKNDEKGHHIEIDDFINDDVIRSKTFIKYSENGLDNVRTTYQVNGQFTGSYSLTYDSLENLVENKRYYPDGNLAEKQVFTNSNFDQNGNWLLRSITQSIHTHDFQFELSYIIIKRKIEYY